MKQPLSPIAVHNAQVKAEGIRFAEARAEVAPGAAVDAAVAELAPYRTWYAERFARDGDPATWPDWARLAGTVKGAVRQLYQQWCSDRAAFVAERDAATAAPPRG